jgi:hypothetical protein
LAIQTLVIQPHIDAAFTPVSVEAAHFSAQPKEPSHDTQGVCVICQAVATAGAVALSASPTLALIEHSVVAPTPARRAQPSQRARSHNWQSRAPPQTV